MRGGGLRRDIATHTTKMPTQITTTVAQTGTMIFRSSHSGMPGKPAFPPANVESEPPVPVPNGGAIVPAKEYVKG